MQYSDEHLRYLRLLSQKYQTVAAAASEIIRIEALLRLPKGTEHFMSDLHGEHEAFVHILNSASGVIREKIDTVLGNGVPAEERAELATLVYYPNQKLPELKARQKDLHAWYRMTLLRLIDLCRFVSSKHTRDHVRRCLPQNCGYILDELLHAHFEDHDKDQYYGEIIESIIRYDRADAYIIRFCEVIKRLAVDRLHIVGDLFDRGPRPDRILDSLMAHHQVDIQWGNHDVVWMGAAAGSLILLLIQPARCTAGIQLTRFAHYISSLLCGVFLFKVCFCILISGNAFRVQRAALFFHKINAALECVAKSPIQILHFQRAQVVYAGPVALGAGHFGQIDDLIELGHSRLAGSMAADSRQNFRVGDAPLCFGQDGGGDAVPDRRRTCGGIFCYYSIIGKNLQQLLLGQFLGGIVQNCRHSGLFRGWAPAPGKFYSHFFYIFRVRPALFAQAGLDQLLGFGVLHGSPSPLFYNFCIVMAAASAEGSRPLPTEQHL